MYAAHWLCIGKKMKYDINIGDSSLSVRVQIDVEGSFADSILPHTNNFFREVHEKLMAILAEHHKKWYAVLMDDVGPNKISTIKTVRQYTNLGLKEAKDLVESVDHGPKVLSDKLTKEEALRFAQELTSLGCKATAAPLSFMVMR